MVLGPRDRLAPLHEQSGPSKQGPLFFLCLPFVRKGLKYSNAMVICLPPSRSESYHNISHQNELFATTAGVRRGPSPPSNLASCELNVDEGMKAAAVSYSTKYAHRGQLQDWLTICSEMTSVDLGLSMATIANCNACGSEAWVQFSPSRSQYRAKFKRCGLRVCPTCGIRLGFSLSRRVREWIGTPQLYKWRMITLSMRSTDAPLKAQINELRKSFRRLRQSKVWSTTQNYGLAVVEVTFNTTTNQWHPHLHVLMHGQFLPVGCVRAAWWNASHEGARVHLRNVDSSKQAGNYVAKYVGKGCKLTRSNPDGTVEPLVGTSLVDLPQEKLRQWIQATCKSRWVIPVGDGPSLPEDKPDPEEKGTNDWQTITTLEGLMRKPYRSAEDEQIIAALELDPKPCDDT